MQLPPLKVERWPQEARNRHAGAAAARKALSHRYARRKWNWMLGQQRARLYRIGLPTWMQ